MRTSEWHERQTLDKMKWSRAGEGGRGLPGGVWHLLWLLFVVSYPVMFVAEASAGKPLKNHRHDIMRKFSILKLYDVFWSGNMALHRIPLTNTYIRACIYLHQTMGQRYQRGTWNSVRDWTERVLVSPSLSMFLVPVPFQHHPIVRSS